MQSAHRTGYVYSVFFVMILIPALALAGSSGDSSNRVVRFTAPADCDTPNGVTKQQVAFFLRNPKPGFDPVQSEVWRLRNEQRCTVRQDVVESFEKLLKIAQENNVDYLSLAIYALGKKDKNTDGEDNRRETKTAQNSSDARKRNSIEQTFKGDNRESKRVQQVPISKERSEQPVKTARQPAAQGKISELAKQCDAVGSSSMDSMRRAAGVSWDDLKVEQAIDVCARAFRENPDDPVLAFQLGRGLHKAERRKEALHYYKLAVEKQYPAAFYNIGYSYEELHNPMEAIKWYKAGAELGDPSCQYAMGNVYRLGVGTGFVRYATKDYKKARYWYEQALKNGYTEAKQAMIELNAQPMADALSAFGAFFGGGGNPSEPERDEYGWTKEQRQMIDALEMRKHNSTLPPELR